MSFDRLAPHYTWMEAVLAGRRLQRARLAWLDRLAGAQRILVAGVGHGPFVPACARRFPKSELVCVDASARMLAAARQRLGSAAANVRFVHATLPAWTPPPESFDAVVTHFFLDCFPPAELREVIGLLAAAARPEARWLVTDFAVPARGWKRQRARAIHALMYAFFRPVTRVRARRVTPPDALLRAHGFALQARRAVEWGLVQSDFWTRSASAG